MSISRGLRAYGNWPLGILVVSAVGVPPPPYTLRSIIVPNRPVVPARVPRGYYAPSLIRDDFATQICRKDPLLGMASDEQRTRVLLSDDTPEEFDNFLYRYLMSLFASRESRLDSLADGGRPHSHSRPLTGTLRNPGSG